MDETTKRNITTLSKGQSRIERELEAEKEKVGRIEKQVVDLSNQLNQLRGIVMSKINIGATSR